MAIELASDLGFRPPSGQDPDEVRGAFDLIDTRVRRATGNVSAIAESVTALQETVAAIRQAAEEASDGAGFKGVQVENNGAVYVMAGTGDLSPQWMTLSAVLAENPVVENAITRAFTTTQSPGFVSIPESTEVPAMVLVGDDSKVASWMPANQFADKALGLKLPQSSAGWTFPLSNNQSGWTALPPATTATWEDCFIMSAHFDSYVNHYANLIYALVEALKTAKVLT